MPDEGWLAAPLRGLRTLPQGRGDTWLDGVSEQQKCYREYRAAATAAAARRAIPQEAPAENEYDTGHSEIDLYDVDEDTSKEDKGF